MDFHEKKRLWPFFSLLEVNNRFLKASFLNFRVFCILDVHQIPLKPESVGVQQKLTKKEIISPEKVFMDSVRAIVPSISHHHFLVIKVKNLCSKFLIHIQ